MSRNHFANSLMFELIMGMTLRRFLGNSMIINMLVDIGLALDYWDCFFGH